MDRREMYQRRADEIAEERYHKDFYDLSPDTRDAVYCEAVMDTDDMLISQAEALGELAKEREWEAIYDRT